MTIDDSRRSLVAVVAFPLLVSATFVLLVGLNLNGSSVAVLGNPKTDHSLVVGHPRKVRSDEYLIQTPNAIGNVRRSLPVQSWFGLVKVREPAVTLGSPSSDWSEILRPQDWGYFLSASRGLAWHWWFSFLVGLVGLYALLWALLGKVWVSAALSVVGAMSPYTGWWSSPSTAMLLGYAAGGTACVVLALRARRNRVVVGLAVVGGLSIVGLALTLYPPWQVSLGLVCLAVGIGQAIDYRVSLRRVALTLCTAGLVAGVPLAVWYVQNRAAIAAIASTFYPGLRISLSGGAKLAWLLDAPLNPWLAGQAGSSLRVPPGAIGIDTYVNQSETSSSWLPVGVLVALVLALGWTFLARAVASRRMARATPGTPEPSGEVVSGVVTGVAPRAWTFWLVTAMMALLAAWALLPLPALVGRLTLLDRVPPWRLPLALGFAALLMVALGAQMLQRAKLGLGRAALLLLGAVATAVATGWSADQLPWRGSLVSSGLVLASGLGVGAGFAVVASGRGQRLGALLLAGYCFCSWALVNPLYHGLGPLETDRVVTAMSVVEKHAPGTIAAVYGDIRLVALVASSGVQSLSGTTFYPDPAIWATLAPSQRGLWNNYVTFRWTALPAGEPASIVKDRGTSMNLRIDPCSKEALALGMSWALSQTPLTGSCLRPVDTLASVVGTVYRYRVVASG